MFGKIIFFTAAYKKFLLKNFLGCFHQNVLESEIESDFDDEDDDSEERKSSPRNKTVIKSKA